MRSRVFVILQKTGAVIDGHFQLSSGFHSGKYIQCAKAFQYPDIAREACQFLIKKFASSSVEVVIGPALGAVTLAYEVARQRPCSFYRARARENDSPTRV